MTPRCCRFPRGVPLGLPGRCWVLVVLGCCLLGPAARPETSAARPATSLSEFLERCGYAPIPLERGPANELFVRGLLNGRRRRFEIDTGTGMNRLAPRLARGVKRLRDLGTHIEDPRLGLLTNRNLLILETVEFGRARFTNQPALAWDRESAAAFPEQEVLLGYDFLYRHQALLDCREKRMYLRSGPLAAGVRAAMETSLANSGFEAIRLSTNGGLAVEARIAGQPARLLLDTGSGVTVLDREAAERFGLRLEAVEGYAHRLRRVPGELAIARVELLEVGTLRFSERTAAVADLGPWVEDAADDTWSGVDGALGVEFLGGHPALIDCRDQRLYLKKLAQ